MKNKKLNRKFVKNYKNMKNVEFKNVLIITQKI